MARQIRMTEEARASYVDAFLEALKLVKPSDGKINFTKEIGSVDRKAEIMFTPTAWAKMTALIMGFETKEVAWHGVAERVDDPEKDLYLISDIVVYPQTVTSGTVDMDEVEYGNWMMEHLGDPRFSKLRMQGHSHVKMATSPSPTDLKHQDDILALCGEDDFYIFMIWNQYFTSTSWIYDFGKNILFENKDITISMQDQQGLSEFMAEARSLVKQTTTTYSYNKPAAAAPAAAKPAAAPAASPAKPAVPAATPAKPAAPAAPVNSAPASKTRTNVTDYAGWGYDYDDYGYPYYGYGSAR